MGMIMVMSGPDEYDKAMSKARDPNMTTVNNPLFTGRPSAEDLLVQRNMETLREDACRKKCPVHGAVYEGITSMRYPNGGE